MDGRLLVSDTRNHRVQIFQNDQLVAVLGELGDGNDQFRLPTASAVNTERDILVLDSKHGLIKVFGPDLKFKAGFGGVGSAPRLLNMPQGMRLDSNGHVWVADTGNHRIQEFSPTGTLLSVVGKKGSGPGEFDSPTGVVCREDKVYVADNGNRRVQILARISS
jgi:DNA-binding beta-propeller fold protein YncE